MLLANMENRIESNIDTNLIVELWNEAIEHFEGVMDTFDRQQILSAISNAYKYNTGEVIQIFKVAGIIREIEKKQNEEGLEVEINA